MAKDGALAKSPVLSETSPQPDVITPLYTDDEIKYLGGLQARLKRALAREKPWDEFAGMTYLQYWEANEKGANTFIEPKANKEDSNFKTGTIRQKLFALLSALINLDLSPR